MIKVKHLVCCLYLLLTACAANPTITASNKATSYEKKIDNLSIIYLANKFGVKETSIHQNEFNKLSIAFKNAGIKTNLFLYSELDLNSSEHLNNSVRKNSYALIINPIETTTYTGDTINVTYNLSLYESAINQKIWVATLWVPLSWTKSIFQRYDEMGSLIVKELIKSGFISAS